MNSLKQKALGGVKWTFIDTFVIKGLFFIAMIYLARILGPKEFGYLGMISIFMGLGITIFDGGMSASIIRTKETDNVDYSTVFFVNVLVSIFIYIIFFILSPLIADFYNYKIIEKLIRFYCLILIIMSFSSVQLAILNKKMQFKKIALVNLPSTLLGIGLGVYLAYNNYGIWSVVWMLLIIELIKTVLYWLISSWKPQFLFSIEKFKCHYLFGYKLMLSGLLDHLFKNMYNLIIGKYFRAEMLGYFERSRQLNDYPSSTLNGIISRVTYPLLAEIQNDKDKVKDVYRRISLFALFIIAPIMLWLAAIAKPLFLILLGEEWLPAVPLFQVLSFASILYPIHSFSLNVLKVYGRSDLFLKLEIIKKIITVVAILITFQFGLMGLVWSAVLASVNSLFVNIYYTGKIINYGFFEQLKEIFLVLFVAILMFVITYFFMLNVANEFQIFIQIILATFVGLIVYLVVSISIKSNPIHYSIRLLKNKNK